MPLALATASVFMLALLWDLVMPGLRRLRSRLPAPLGGRDPRARTAVQIAYDPGRERRAEQRARALLRSCVDEEEWAMYRDLGLLRMWGGSARRSSHTGGPAAGLAGGSADGCTGGPPYAYLIYPHKPIVAYVPHTGQLLNEYCVGFPDHTRPYGSPRLPDSDDVLAKWLALRADERGLIADANMHLPGRQIDPEQVRRDLQRLSRWETERLAGGRRRGLPIPGLQAGLEAERQSDLGMA